MTPRNPTSAARSDSAKKCLAAGMGALFLGLGDLISNGSAATIIKMSEIFGRHLSSLFDTPGFSLLLLVMLGGLLAWIYEPDSRREAFTRGLSVFAILAVTTPYDQVPPGLDEVVGDLPAPTEQGAPIETSALPPAGWAFAAEDQESPPPAGRPKVIGQATIRLQPHDPTTTLEGATVTIRDVDSGRRLGFDRVVGPVVSISRPVGRYLVEVESPGFKRVRFELEISAREQTFYVTLPSSRVPVALQRLANPAEVALTRRPRVATSASVLGIVHGPSSLAWVSDSLIVLESGGRLLRLGPDGRAEALVESFGAFRPYDVAAATVAGHEVILVTLRGAAFNKLTTFLDGVRNDLVLPRLGFFTGVAIDGQGAIAYLSDGENGAIYSVDLSGGQPGRPRYVLTVHGAGLLAAMTFDPSGNRLFVADALEGDVFEVRLDDAAVRRLAEGLRDPAALVFQPSLERLLVAEADRGRITSLAADGSASVFSELESMRTPRGLAVDGENNIWVADRWTSRIVGLSPAGGELRVMQGG